jgi:hypothetical protein
MLARNVAHAVRAAVPATVFGSNVVVDVEVVLVVVDLVVVVVSDVTVVATVVVGGAAALSEHAAMAMVAAITLVVQRYLLFTVFSPETPRWTGG